MVSAQFFGVWNIHPESTTERYANTETAYLVVYLQIPYSSARIVDYNLKYPMIAAECHIPDFTFEVLYVAQMDVMYNTFYV